MRFWGSAIVAVLGRLLCQFIMPSWQRAPSTAQIIIFIILPIIGFNIWLTKLRHRRNESADTGVTDNHRDRMMSRTNRPRNSYQKYRTINDDTEISEHSSTLNAALVTELHDNTEAHRSVSQTGSLSSGNRHFQNSILSNMLIRARLALQDKDFYVALDLYDRALNIDPYCPDAYLGRVLVDCQVSKIQDLVFEDPSFQSSSNWQRLLKYASQEDRLLYFRIAHKSNEHKEQVNRRIQYERAKRLQDERKEARRKLKIKVIVCASIALTLLTYFGCKNLLIPYIQESRIERENATVYQNAEQLMADGQYSAASEKFRSLGEYRDAYSRINEPYYKQGETLYAGGRHSEAIAAFVKAGAYGDARSRVASIYYEDAEKAVALGDFNTAALHYLNAHEYEYSYTRRQNTEARLKLVTMYYNAGLSFVESGAYDEAATMFEKAIGYNTVNSSEVFPEYADSTLIFYQPYYVKAEKEYADGNTETAIMLFTAAGDYLGAKDYLALIYYNEAEAHLLNQEYEQASMSFAEAASYADPTITIAYADKAASRINEPYYIAGEEALEAGNTELAVEYYLKSTDIPKSKARLTEFYYKQAVELMEAGNYEGASQAFATASTYVNAVTEPIYMDAKARISEPYYVAAEAALSNGDHEQAIYLFINISGFSDADERWTTIVLSDAQALVQQGSVDDAITLLSTYRVKKTVIQQRYEQLVYEQAVKAMNDCRYDDAEVYFARIPSYNDTAEMLQQVKYQKATKLLNAGSYKEAYAVFSSIKEYKDVSVILKSNQYMVWAERMLIADSSIGDYVIFGNYEQNNDTNDGKEPLEWRVLDKQDGRVLLITRYIIDSHYFHTSSKVKTWDKSNIRSWLNSTFMNNAFTFQEQKIILLVDVTADVYTGGFSWVDQGRDTKDQVFLLSAVEAERYFKSNSDMYTTGTKYANGKGAKFLDENAWLLRSIGYQSPGYILGKSGTNGFAVDLYIYSDEATGVRPAVWIDLTSSYFTTPQSVDSYSTQELDGL